MSAVKFRFDASGLRRRTEKLGAIMAEDFRAELMDFVRKSLQTASRNTPARDYSLIRQAQIRQYNARVNCIPSSHELVDPSLRINGRQHWLFYRGKWLNAKDWRLSDDAFVAYSQLLGEHERRKQTAQSTFIKERAQARFLYRRSWIGAADDLGITLNLAQPTRAAHSRRKPAAAPPRSRGSVRGGGKAISIQVSNPFLETKSRYKDFTGKPIITAAMASHQDQYRRNIKRRLVQMAKAAK